MRVALVLLLWVALSVPATLFIGRLRSCTGNERTVERAYGV